MKKVFTFLLVMCLSFSGTMIMAQNHALDFDGSSNKVGILDSPELNPTAAMTLEAWINAEEWQSSIWAGVIISKQGSGPDKGWCLSAGENGRLEFTVSVDEGWKSVATPQLLGTNAWYHVAGVYTGTQVKVYINGVLIGAEDAIGSLTPGEGVVVNIGENPTWTGRYFNGMIDEVRIWEVARTDAEIQASMSTELTGSEAGLVAYYPMNEGTGMTIADATSNGNDGQLINMSEDNWVDGFVPVTADIGVMGIASPSYIGSGFAADEKIRLEVKNYATEPITEFEITYQITGSDAITETVVVTIPPFETYIYTFEDLVDLSGETEIEITGSVSLDGDDNAANDVLTEMIEPTLNFMIFDEERHNYGGYGQTHTKTLYMPESLEDFSEIYIHIDLECPTGGCDPWDQPAKLMINKDGENYEIARYITPYGVACGGWTWDITDFRSLLVDEVDWVSYVQVWGASGWLVDVELELIEGSPEYPFVKIEKLWSEDNWVYGDPDVNDDFPEMDVMIHPETEAAKIRMTMTGHGQANTSNAAEFSDFTHHIWVDGEETFEQHLWKDDCDVNSCAPQSGTYLYSRAGWCPGQDVQPWEWDMDGHFTPGEMVNLDYVLYDYTNLLNTGYNGGSHTEPHYRCHTYFVQYSTEDIVGISDQSVVMDHIQAYPNPTTGLYNIKMVNDNIKTIDVYQLNSQLVASYQLNGDQEFQLDLSDMPNGIYMIKVQSENHTTVLKTVKSN
ncbi:LamG-like jellyroll fold domain-containing protein [Lentimicrobium sp. S6]|uniref:LamG-like jellyroll fold domain-containing protein n=1 Tax=Lentimicrobium sp. S6 TaxID=2735872 RepID=UPI0015528245|nr:LamG-like jellyroll fold domain-containing protein [Lentimicrobium sp. S6]NPD45059.1 T9SS type A sorting domain-containing protein [Lentimicrobium sp. S6]